MIFSYNIHPLGLKFVQKQNQDKPLANISLTYMIFAFISSSKVIYLNFLNIILLTYVKPGCIMSQAVQN